MGTERMIWGIVAFSAMFCPIIGIIIGAIRYNRHGSRLKREYEEQFKNAKQKGGMNSLLYKQESKRVFAKTFGRPMALGLLIGIILMLVAFQNL